MFPIRKSVIVIVISGVVSALAIGVVLFFEPIQVGNRLVKNIHEREKQLLYETDHAALASELRKFADEQRWRQPGDNSPPKMFWPNDDAVPASLRVSKPTSITIFDDRIMFERGGPILHFGIVVFREGIVGEGLKQLAPGVWFYADNNRIPAE